MLRGIFIGRYAAFGALTTTMVACKAASKMTTHELLDVLTNPVLVYFVYLIAVVILFYPHLVGKKALVLAPLIALGVAFFVYAYYMI